MIPAPRPFGRLLAAIAFAAATALVLAPRQATAQQETDAGQFIQDLGNKAIAQLAGKGIPEQEEETRFRQLLVQYFDLTAIGKFTVGRAYWASASPAQQQQFLGLYETQVTKAYAKRFQNYSGQQFKVTGSEKEGSSDTLVNSEIISPDGGQPVTVQWRVRMEDGGLKVVDVVIAGISMAVSDKQQFSAVIERGGGSIQPLIDALTKQDVTPASASN